MIHHTPLLACYGGGHVQIIAAVARAMRTQGLDPQVIGFTTAYRALQRAGIPARSVEVLLEPRADAPYLQAVASFIGAESHPDVTQSETRAYYALGFRDLVERMGWDAATNALRQEGRKAFEPVSVMARYLRKSQPDIVITTTSPRFELALLKAARQMGIPTLAVGDLFLVKEREWILQPDYAEHLAVLSEDVARSLIADGLEESAIRVTGNPAFDSLAPRPGDSERRKTLRRNLGLAEKTVVLWPAASAAVSMIGRPFQSPENVISALERLCRNDPSFAYIYRAHPNQPFTLPDDARHGRLDDGTLSPEEALLVSDVVCVEASTMGLQAALARKPVICVGYSDYVIYPKSGLAREAETLDEAIEILQSRTYAAASSVAIPPVGTATSRLLAFINDILASTTHGRLA